MTVHTTGRFGLPHRDVGIVMGCQDRLGLWPILRTDFEIRWHPTRDLEPRRRR